MQQSVKNNTLNSRGLQHSLRNKIITIQSFLYYPGHFVYVSNVTHSTLYVCLLSHKCKLFVEEDRRGYTLFISVFIVPSRKSLLKLLENLLSGSVWVDHIFSLPFKPSHYVLVHNLGFSSAVRGVAYPRALYILIQAQIYLSLFNLSFYFILNFGSR